MDQGLSPCEALLGQQSLLPAHYYSQSWEVGRLVLAPQFRSSPDLLKRCLCLTLLFMLDSQQVTNIFASCTPLLARLYRRFGFSVLLKDAAQDGGESYALIHGLVGTVLQAVAGSDAEREVAQRAMAVVPQDQPQARCEYA